MTITEKAQNLLVDILHNNPGKYLRVTFEGFG